jgi:hypothetical protein
VYETLHLGRILDAAKVIDKRRKSGDLHNKWTGLSQKYIKRMTIPAPAALAAAASAPPTGVEEVAAPVGGQQTVAGEMNTSDTFQIFIETCVNTLPLDVATADTVETLKAMIYRELSVPPALQSLMFSGERLCQGSRTLTEYNIKKDSQVVLLLANQVQDDIAGYDAQSGAAAGAGAGAEAEEGAGAYEEEARARAAAEEEAGAGAEGMIPMVKGEEHDNAEDMGDDEDDDDDDMEEAEEAEETEEVYTEAEGEEDAVGEKMRIMQMKMERATASGGSSDEDEEDEDNNERDAKRRKTC